MDFFGIDIFTLIASIAILGIAITITVLLYVLVYKPKVQQPLPNERPLGYWTIWLKEHGIKTGFACTAQRTFEGLLTQIFENETDETIKTNLQDAKKILHKFHPIAHRAEGKTHVYLFTDNPLDQRFMDEDPDRNDSYILGHGIEDVLSAGEYAGMKFLAVKLSSESHRLVTEEAEELGTLLDVCKYLRDAAKNTGKIAALKEELTDQKEEKEKLQKALRETESKLDDAAYALTQKPLTVEQLAIPGGLKEKIKQWFTWQQFIVALIGYFVISPTVLSWLSTAYGYSITPPTTTYVTTLITIVSFFTIPMFKKLFGRWL